MRTRVRMSSAKAVTRTITCYACSAAREYGSAVAPAGC